MKLADLPIVQQLSRDEQLELVADLWGHIATQPDDDLVPVTAPEAALLEERVAAHEAAPGTAVTLEVFKHLLAQRLCAGRPGFRQARGYAPN